MSSSPDTTTTAPVPGLVQVWTGKAPVCRTMPVREKPILLGRHANATLVLDDDRLSRTHANVARIGTRWVITDLGSRNRTFVNGQPISASVEAERECVVRVGGVVAFVVEDSRRFAGRSDHDASVRKGIEARHARAAPEVSTLPPLRERMEEIAFLVQLAVDDSDSGLPMTPAFIEACMLRPWPGNDRQLLDAVKAAVARALGKDKQLEPAHLGDAGLAPKSEPTPSQRARSSPPSSMPSSTPGGDSTLGSGQRPEEFKPRRGSR